MKPWSNLNTNPSEYLALPLKEEVQQLNDKNNSLFTVLSQQEICTKHKVDMKVYITDIRISPYLSFVISNFPCLSKIPTELLKCSRMETSIVNTEEAGTRLWVEYLFRRSRKAKIYSVYQSLSSRAVST